MSEISSSCCGGAWVKVTYSLSGLGLGTASDLHVFNDETIGKLDSSGLFLLSFFLLGLFLLSLFLLGLFLLSLLLLGLFLLGLRLLSVLLLSLLLGLLLLSSGSSGLLSSSLLAVLGDRNFLLFFLLLFFFMIFFLFIAFFNGSWRWC